jgi:hypothetical protein
MMMSLKTIQNFSTKNHLIKLIFTVVSQEDLKSLGGTFLGHSKLMNLVKLLIRKKLVISRAEFLYITKKKDKNIK